MKQFVLDLTAILDVQKQRTEQSADVGCTYVQSAMACMAFRSMSRLDSLFKIAVKHQPVIHRNDVWQMRAFFQVKIFQM